MQEKTGQQQTKAIEDMTLDELDELEDEEDDRVLQQYRCVPINSLYLLFPFLSYLFSF